MQGVDLQFIDFGCGNGRSSEFASSIVAGRGFGIDISDDAVDACRAKGLAAERAGLVVEQQLAFGPDYAETLRRWRADFLHRDAEVRQLGFDTRFMRIWEFYLAYCEAAFAAGNTNVVQFTLRKPT